MVEDSVALSQDISGLILLTAALLISRMKEGKFPL